MALLKWTHRPHQNTYVASLNTFTGNWTFRLAVRPDRTGWAATAYLNNRVVLVTRVPSSGAGQSLCEMEAVRIHDESIKAKKAFRQARAAEKGTE